MRRGAQQVQASPPGTAHPRARSPARSLLPEILPREQKEEENHTSPCFTAAAWLSVLRQALRREPRPRSLEYPALRRRRRRARGPWLQARGRRCVRRSGGAAPRGRGKARAHQERAWPPRAGRTTGPTPWRLDRPPPLAARGLLGAGPERCLAHSTAHSRCATKGE